MMQKCLVCGALVNVTISIEPLFSYDYPDPDILGVIKTAFSKEKIFTFDFKCQSCKTEVRLKGKNKAVEALAERIGLIDKHVADAIKGNGQ